MYWLMTTYETHYGAETADAVHCSFVLGILMVSSQPGLVSLSVAMVKKKKTGQKQLGGGKGLFKLRDYSLLLRRAGAGAQGVN